jgi:quaternary ammonium compound-resistance protein SugE
LAPPAGAAQLWKPARIHRTDTNARYAPIPKTGEVQRMSAAWFSLLMAGMLEVAWALGLKYSDGFTRPWPSVATLVAIAASFAFLSFALKSVPFGTAYAIWTGLGAAGTLLTGIVLFGEPADAARLGCVLLIIGGIVGLKIVTPS